jgi:hypothetical protein
MYQNGRKMIHIFIHTKHITHVYNVDQKS